VSIQATLMGEPVIKAHRGNKVDIQFEMDQANFMAYPLAFWNRPDGDYFSEKPYQPVIRYYDATMDMTFERAL
jgi:hypothetical protein